MFSKSKMRRKFREAVVIGRSFNIRFAWTIWGMSAGAVVGLILYMVIESFLTSVISRRIASEFGFWVPAILGGTVGFLRSKRVGRKEAEDTRRFFRKQDTEVPGRRL